MTKFRVCGPRTVNGIAPGGTFDVDDEAWATGYTNGINLGALITAGHIELVGVELRGEHGPEPHVARPKPKAERKVAD